MKVYTYSEARQRLSKLLDIARDEEVIIKRRGGETFSIILKKEPKSPFDVPGIKTKVTTKDILNAIRESRSRAAEPNTSSNGYNRRRLLFSIYQLHVQPRSARLYDPNVPSFPSR